MMLLPACICVECPPSRVRFCTMYHAKGSRRFSTSSLPAGRQGSDLCSTLLLLATPSYRHAPGHSPSLREGEYLLSQVLVTAEYHRWQNRNVSTPIKPPQTISNCDTSNKQPASSNQRSKRSEDPDISSGLTTNNQQPATGIGPGR